MGQTPIVDRFFQNSCFNTYGVLCVITLVKLAKLRTCYVIKEVKMWTHSPQSSIEKVPSTIGVLEMPISLLCME
jgi:hypothetical protein